jgi:secondary thiamine-phosphate synthase enzyme
MSVYTYREQIKTRGQSEVLDITAFATKAVQRSGQKDGVLHVFVPGSTAAVTTIEFESGVIRDLRAAIERLVPETIAYEHDRRWGDGNGYSHVRAALMKPGLTIPFQDSCLLLGTWQQLVLIDFDNRPRTREIIFQILGG